jgi:F0F1-type ATP synthase assembly protein I
MLRNMRKFTILRGDWLAASGVGKVVPKVVLQSMRHTAYLTITIPIAIVVIIGLLAWLFSGAHIAYSIVLGGAIWALPNGYMAFKLFHRIETNAKRFVAVFYTTEFLKLLFIAVLFITVVKLLSVNLAGMLAGYVCAQVAFWVVSGFKF